MYCARRFRWLSGDVRARVQRPHTGSRCGRTATASRVRRSATAAFRSSTCRTLRRWRYVSRASRPSRLTLSATAQASSGTWPARSRRHASPPPPTTRHVPDRRGGTVTVERVLREVRNPPVLVRRWQAVQSPSAMARDGTLIVRSQRFFRLCS